MNGSSEFNVAEMHDAFLSICLLKDYPYALECLSSYDNFLVVGTKQGLLLIYEITPSVITHPVYFIPPLSSRSTGYHKKAIRLNLNYAFSSNLSDKQLPSTTGLSTTTVPPPTFSTRVHITRTLGKRPILQVTALPELDLLLALADGHLNVYQLQNCQLITTVPNSKGASAFTHCLSCADEGHGPVLQCSNSIAFPYKSSLKQQSSKTSFSNSGVVQKQRKQVLGLHLCVVVKRRLFFWRWDDLTQEFIRPGGFKDPFKPDWSAEVALPDVTRCAQFFDSTQLIVGFRAEYSLLNISTGEFHPISTTSRNQIPFICPIVDYSPSHLFPDTARQTNPSSLSVSPETAHTMSNRLGVSQDGSGACAAYLPSGVHSLFEEDALSQQWRALFGLGHDELLTLFVSGSHMEQPAQIRWTGSPSQVLSCPPYLLGAMENFLEVRVLEPCELVQQLAIPRVQAFCCNGGWVYAATAPHAKSSLISDLTHVASSGMKSSSASPPAAIGSGNEVWLILSVNRTVLVEQLVKSKEFEVALHLARESPWSGQMPIETRPISTLHSLYLLQQREYSRAFALFFQLGIDPSHVLGLFSHLLPESFRPLMESLKSIVVALGDDQFIGASESIITYLLTWRRLLRRQIVNEPEADNHIQCYPIGDNMNVVKSVVELLELVDTALLKCYVATNTARLGPLLRQQNWCQLHESEQTLIINHQYEELVTLYQSSGMHPKALAILQRLGLLFLKQSGISIDQLASSRISNDDHSYSIIDPSKIQGSTLAQVAHPRVMVHYLQALEPSMAVQFVFDYADWIMHTDPTRWMRIFTSWENRLSSTTRDPTNVSSDDKTVKALSTTYRSKVLKHLETHAVHLIIPFLERLIFAQFEADSDSEDDTDLQNNDSFNVSVSLSYNNTSGSNVTANDTLEAKNVCVSGSFVGDTSFAESESTLDPSLFSDEESERVQPSDRGAHLQTSSFISTPITGSCTSLAVVNSLWRLPGWRRTIMLSNGKTNQTNDQDQLPRIVRQLEDADPVELHTRYAGALLNRALALQSPGKPFAFRVDDEQPRNSPVARLRRRLLRFLQHIDTTYSSARLLSQCPYDAFFEERALLLANLNRHDQALTLWVHLLDDWNRALTHCQQVFERSRIRYSNEHALADELAVEKDYVLVSIESDVRSQSNSAAHLSTSSRSPSSLDEINTALHQAGHPASLYGDGIVIPELDIFFLLIRICLMPPDLVNAGVVIPKTTESDGTVVLHPLATTEMTPKVDNALEVLRKFGDRVDACKLVRIASTLRLTQLSDYLKATLIHQEALRTHLIFLRNAAQVELAASRTGLIRASSQQNFLVSSSSLCRTCRRRIGTSAFIRHPATGELEHYGCCRLLVPPGRRRP